MDFSQFDSRAAGNKGAWMHVCHPGTGKPMYDKGKPCEVLVYGIESDIGLRVLDSARAAMKEDDASGDLPDLATKGVKDAAPLIGGFRNINRGDEPAKAPDDAEWFLGLQVQIAGDKKTFLQQVREFSMRRDNLLKNGSSD